jgi:hypothetical protein
VKLAFYQFFSIGDGMIPKGLLLRAGYWFCPEEFKELEIPLAVGL